jgi:restriction system protein
MARRGFFAELQHQASVAARDAQRAQAAQVRQHQAAIREADRARSAAERAAAKAQHATESERKRLEKEAREAHIAAMQAQVEERNAALEEVYEEIDSLLTATLDKDDYVDLETLRRRVEHPPFDRTGLEQPIPPPKLSAEPVEPVYVDPEPPKALFGKKKKHEEVIRAARSEYEKAHAAWEAEMAGLPARRQAAQDAYEQAEARRRSQLEAARRHYEAGCAAREAEVAEDNAQLDALITNLGYGTTGAVEEYLSIVLANSVYPAHFPVRHEFSFEPATAELSLQCLIPPPSEVPTVKAYKYNRSADEITETALPQKAAKDRYAGAVHQVALRSLHECSKRIAGASSVRSRSKSAPRRSTRRPGTRPTFPSWPSPPIATPSPSSTSAASCQPRPSHTLERPSPRTPWDSCPPARPASASRERRPRLQPAAGVAGPSTGVAATRGLAA